MKYYSALRDHMLAQGLSTRTVESYLSDLAMFARWYEQHTGKLLSPQRLSSTDLRQYKDYLQKVKNAAAATVNRRLAALRTYSAWALNMGFVKLDPSSGIKGVEENKTSPRFLQSQEQAALVNQVDTLLTSAWTEASCRQARRDRAIVLLLLHTGLRVSELCSLELNDIENLGDASQVRVRAVDQGKVRRLPINRSIRKVLDNWLEVRPQVGTRAVFVGKHGEAASPLLVQRLLAELGRRAGLEVTPQILRNTFARNLLDQGVSLDRVAALLGHSSLRTTVVYTSNG